MGIRDRAKEILSVVPEPPRQINSDGPTAAQFTDLTGTKHATMWKNWEGGGEMTACNGFVGWYGRELGSKTYLGDFDTLATIAKGPAWVKSTADARPKYGDICRHTAFHMDVALDFDGNKFNRVGAGQGRPIRRVGILVGGHDVLKRIHGEGPYDFNKLQGWVDIELYFGPAAQTGPVPEWLLGWWKVTWRGQTYYYYFQSDRQVKWTQDEHFTLRSSPFPARGTGIFAVLVTGEVITRWGDTGTVENFEGAVSADDGLMRGRLNGIAPLTAVRM